MRPAYLIPPGTERPITSWQRYNANASRYLLRAGTGIIPATPATWPLQHDRERFKGEAHFHWKCRRYLLGAMPLSNTVASPPGGSCWPVGWPGRGITGLVAGGKMMSDVLLVSPHSTPALRCRLALVARFCQHPLKTADSGIKEKKATHRFEHEQHH